MNNLGLFFQFGIRMQGGPAFLKRTRSAQPQLQTRTSTATTGNQLQTRTRSKSTSTTNDLRGYLCYYESEGYFGYWQSNGTLTCHPGVCNQYGYYCTNFGFFSCNNSGNIGCLEYQCRCQTSYGAYGAWSNTTSCSPSDTRQCQTISICVFGDFTGWSNTSSCTPSSPACTTGAVKRECQTIFNWGSFSAYEEVDICVPQTPALGAGAVEIECVPQ